MIIEEFIPILAIIGFGLFILKIFNLKRLKFSIPEQIIYVLTIFCSFYIIPMSFFGLRQFKYFFQTWPLILALVGLFYFGFLIYNNFKYIIQYLETIGSFNSINENWVTFKPKNLTILVLISILLLFFTIFNLILPFRDFDAIWMYIPDAMWYYRVNFIPVFNPLNFTVSTKEPLTALLFTFSLYTTNSLNIKLLPILFIIGWGSTIYSFVDKIWEDQSKSLMAVLLFLISPFMYYILNFWVYYQEIYVSFFYSVTLLCVFNLLQLGKTKEFIEDIKRKELFFVIIGSLSFALTLLSKLSGWSLIFIVILVIPFIKLSKLVQTFFISILSFFLFLKVSIDLFIGFGIVILIYLVLILIILWKPNTLYQKSYKEESTNQWLALSIIPLGLSLGGFWLYNSLQKFSQYSSTFINTYFSLSNLQFKTTFTGTSLNSANFLLESAHSADFFAVVLYLLVGNIFVLFWLIPKLRVLFNTEVQFFVLWILGFFMLWLTYDGMVSIRYLSVILVPMIIIVTHGFHTLYEDITHKHQPVSRALIISASILALTSYYYPISPSILTQASNPHAINQLFLQSAYNYYINSLLYLIITFTLSIVAIALFRKKFEFNVQKFTKLLTSRKVGSIAIMLIVFIPFMVPMFVLVSANGNLNDFNSSYYYYQRPAYQEVVNTLLNENSPTSGVLVFDLPGLPIYTNQPTLDLFVQQKEIGPVLSKNISDILQLLLDPIDYAKNNYNLSINTNLASSKFSFDYVVIPNYANNLYPYYVKSYYNKSYLYPLLFQKNLFKNIYDNNEFIIFKRLFTIPQFYGIVDSSLVNSQESTSIMGQVQMPTRFDNNINLTLKCSVPAPKNSNVLINTTITLLSGNQTILINSTTNFNSSIAYPIINDSIPLIRNNSINNTFFIENISIKMLIDSSSTTSIKNYYLTSIYPGIQLSFNSINNYWTISEGSGLYQK